MMPLIVVPREYIEAMNSCPVDHGSLGLSLSIDEDLMIAKTWGYTSAHHGEVQTKNLSREFTDAHFVQTSDESQGYWYRVDPKLHLMWNEVAVRNASLPAKIIREAVHGWGGEAGPGWSTPILTFTVLPDGDLHALAWEIHDNQATPSGLDVFDPNADRLSPLEPHWPLEALSNERIIVIGAGSIGSAACVALSSYGVRNLSIVDPQHLRAHNLARHIGTVSNIGRFKTRVVANALTERDSEMQVEAIEKNVIFDADDIRRLLIGASAVLVCVDGVEPRRVMNHLAYKAHVPAIFACVLVAGQVGEVLRTTQQFGCLTCNRRHLVEAGKFDPEPILDGGYQTGTRELPMTAVGGDLSWVGGLGAKATVATVLERQGIRDQRLPGEHAVLGLRPSPLLPKPFDVGLGEVRWQPSWPSFSECYTCGAPD